MRWFRFEIVLPVLTLVLGYTGTILTERSRDRRTTRRALQAAAVQFERDLMLETQRALYRYAGEVQDFAFAARGESDRTWGAVVGSTWRATAELEMLATRLPAIASRELMGDALAAGQAVTGGDWPGEDEWSDGDRALLDKLVDVLLDIVQRATTMLGDRVRELTYAQR